MLSVNRDMESKGKTKEKRRNTEKRKEKSRYAARCRRSKESEIFSDLAQVIPLPEAHVSNLDKASIMRLVIAHLRVRELFEKLPIPSLKHDDNDTHFLTALSGIVLLMSTDGDIIYVSPNVSTFLGLSEVDIIGQSIFDVCHPCDHKEVRDILAGKFDAEDGKVSFFLRMKCTLTQKGRTLHLKSASYKVLHINGTILKVNKYEGAIQYFTSIGSPIPHPENIEMPLGSSMFLSKHSLDMKYIYADEKMQTFLGYSSDSLIGKSLYEFHHLQDFKIIQKAFKSLFAKGQSETGRYRFLTKGGGYVWVYTQATLIYCDKGNKAESVVCLNYIISEKLNESEVYSTSQLLEQEAIPIPPQPLTSQPVTPQRCKTEVTRKPLPESPKVVLKVNCSDLILERPQHVTSKVFTPRTAEMNKGYVTFDSGLTVLKEDPEDLTHLAPTAGDTCIPLGQPFTLMVDDFSSLPGYASPLLDTGKDTSLFVKCGDDGSTSSLSPVLAKSPDTCSIPSLCSAGDESNFDASPISGYLVQDIEDSRNCGTGPFSLSIDDSGLPLLYDLSWFPSSALSPCISPNAEDITVEDAISPGTKVFKDRSATKGGSVQSFQDQGGGLTTIFDGNIPVLGEPETRKRTSLSVETSKLKKAKKVVNNAPLLAAQDLLHMFSVNMDSGGIVSKNTRKRSSLQPNLLGKS